MATQAEITAIVEEYQNLLLNQYVNLTKARGTIGLLDTEAVCSLVQFDVQNGFNIDTAVGVQLDVLGQYIGLSRTIPGIIERYDFGMPDYGDPLNIPIPAGFTDYTDNTINAGSSFYLYVFANTSFYSLSDSEYRPLLRMKIILNQSNNSLAEIADLLFSVFVYQIICFDNRDMKISYAVAEDTGNSALLAVQAGLLPKPIGVKITGVFLVPDPAKIFGFANYKYANGNELGFSTYAGGFNGQTFITDQDRIDG